MACPRVCEKIVRKLSAVFVMLNAFKLKQLYLREEGGGIQLERYDVPQNILSTSKTFGNSLKQKKWRKKI